MSAMASTLQRNYMSISFITREMECYSCGSSFARRKEAYLQMTMGRFTWSLANVIARIGFYFMYTVT